MQIVEMTNNELVQVTGNPSDPALAHMFKGIAVKRTRAGFMPVARATDQLYSRAHVYKVVQ